MDLRAKKKDKQPKILPVHQESSKQEIIKSDLNWAQGLKLAKNKIA